MAYSNDNVIIQGAHGTFAKQLVFRQRFGQSVLCKRPRKTNRPPSDAQQAVRERFLTASIYAKSVMANPDLLTMYQAAAKNGLSAYNLALADAFRAPEIKELDVSPYTGLIGSTIRIRAIDDFKVNAVQVSIFSAANELLEEGAAAMSNNGLDWIYTATKENQTPGGCTVKVKASDLPGNITLKEQVI
ncbi:hypothetical protein [Chitinophaga nivalis]|uniref:Uncharacterized protein n=1 Tax=Chitinophaga nivalis TaxID=2991709 RepID=A0ABT3IMD2_9BACT|nr:hypothetical protein [Chitinophaga nivalis]MCW3465175.1 hypothetical protein [Chitinophaga nivalis]MCW3485133.1 hypothetical protein [Chitinophaga nivalis]